MSTLVASITATGLEVTARAYRNGEGGANVTPPRAARVVGFDPVAHEVGWVHVETRRLASAHTEIETWVPYYQPTIFVAASASSGKLALGIEQTILVISAAAGGDLSTSSYRIPAPVQAVVSLDDGFLAIHEAGGDLLTDEGTETHVTGRILQWHVVGAEIRYSLE